MTNFKYHMNEGFSIFSQEEAEKHLGLEKGTLSQISNPLPLEMIQRQMADNFKKKPDGIEDGAILPKEIKEPYIHICKSNLKEINRKLTKENAELKSKLDKISELINGNCS